MASTPELLFERSGEQVVSEAVAGTRRRGAAGRQPSLLSDHAIPCHAVGMHLFAETSEALW